MEQKHRKENLPGISYSRNRTSKNLQECVPVCSIVSPNNVAISIGIVAMCPAILFPLLIDYNAHRYFNIVSMIILFRQSCRVRECTTYELMVLAGLTLFLSRFRFYKRTANTHAVASTTTTTSAAAMLLRLLLLSIGFCIYSFSFCVSRVEMCDMRVFSRWFHCHY